MSSTLQLLERLLYHGEVVMYEQSNFPMEERPELLRLLEAAYAEFRLGIAGPLLPFDPEAGLAAAQFLLHSCWLLVSGDENQESIEKSLRFPLVPTSPEAHLSGDLCLRLLVTPYRRVRTRATDDPLHRAIVDVLRRWPLSGAASDIAEPPLGDIQFSNHHGLQLLYAERLAGNLRPAWIPGAGRTREVIELVLQQQGKELLTAEGAAQ
jgi:hypothetical protein